MGTLKLKLNVSFERDVVTWKHIFSITAYLIPNEDSEEIFLLDRLSPGARNKLHSADKEVDVLLEMVIGDCVIEKFREVPRYGPRYVGEAIVCLRLISH